MSWLAALGCLFVAGCGLTPTCDPPPCPKTTTFDLRALDDSVMTWTYRDLNLPPQVTTGFVPAPPMGFDCSFNFPGGQVYQGSEVNLGAITLTCAATPYAPFDLTISGLGDIRDWPAGSFTLVALPRSVALKWPGATNCGDVSFDLLALNVTVEIAAGGSAPFPQLVTGDYARVFRVEFDTASVTPTKAHGIDCDDFPMSGKVSLHLTQTAADYVANPDAVCRCL